MKAAKMTDSKQYLTINTLIFIFGTICPRNVVQSQNYTQENGASMVFKFANVQYEWPNDDAKNKAILSGEYILENNILTGIKVFRDDVYVTVPRWRPGVPSTLNVVRWDGVLRPFPSWSMNKLGDCNSFQYVQSMEVDPNTGYMWAIDVGRVDTRADGLSPRNLCPPKLVVLDIASGNVVMRYEFPDSVVSHTSNFMNDIVLDYVDGEARFAYTTDTFDVKIIVFDVAKKISYYYHHESMRAQPLIPGVQDDLFVTVAVDGIAITGDFQHVYYCALPSLDIFAVPTSTLRHSGSNFASDVVHVGKKAGGTDGMVCGQRSLFYGVLERNAVYKTSTDACCTNFSLATQSEVAKNDDYMKWVDTMAFNGTDLWFLANKMMIFAQNQIDFSGRDENIFIWRVPVGEHGYLWRAKDRTRRRTDPFVIIG